jgi:hypothetical protein
VPIPAFGVVPVVVSAFWLRLEIPQGGIAIACLVAVNRHRNPQTKIFIVSDERCHLEALSVRITLQPPHPLSQYARLFIIALVVFMNDSVDVATCISSPASGHVVNVLLVEFHPCLFVCLLVCLDLDLNCHLLVEA